MYYLLLSLWLTQAEVEPTVNTKEEFTPAQDTVESTFAVNKKAENKLKKQRK